MIQFNPEHQPNVEALFKPGEIIEHRRYGYRGVIVDFDACCQADFDWYQSNQTQPDRFQAWYHVLVHEAVHTTYVAQENLRRDPEAAPIHHPLVERYFKEYRAGVYVRNNQTWP